VLVLPLVVPFFRILLLEEWFLYAKLDGWAVEYPR